MKRVLVIGNTSQLAKEFLSVSQRQKDWQCFLAGRRGEVHFHLDLSDENLLSSELKAQSFDFCLVFAAMTNIRQCEENEDLAMQINCHSIQKLMAQLTVNHWVVFSTNQVFSGNKSLYHKGECVDPHSLYGKTKADMERACLDTRCEVAVVRLTKVIHPQMPLFRNFIESINNGEKVSAYHDMYLAPVNVSDVIMFICNLLRSFTPGIFHLSASNDLSYYDALKFLVEEKQMDSRLVVPATCSMTCPKNTALLVDKVESRYGFASEPAHEIISRTFSKLPGKLAD